MIKDTGDVWNRYKVICNGCGMEFNAPDLVCLVTANDAVIKQGWVNMLLGHFCPTCADAKKEGGLHAPTV